MASSISSLGPLASIAPYHTMLFGTLLGTELFQTFIMTKVCYQALPISAFTTLQKRVFPVYFRLQSLLFLSTALTRPPFGPVSLVSSPSDLIPLGSGGLIALLNMLVWGPRTQEAMVERIHQETRDGKKHNDPMGSEAMKTKNRAFSEAHAMSIHLNLLAVGATIWYGFRLASRMELVVT